MAPRGQVPPIPAETRRGQASPTRTPPRRGQMLPVRTPTGADIPGPDMVPTEAHVPNRTPPNGSMSFRRGKSSSVCWYTISQESTACMPELCGMPERPARRFGRRAYRRDGESAPPQSGPVAAFRAGVFHDPAFCPRVTARSDQASGNALISALGRPRATRRRARSKNAGASPSQGRADVNVGARAVRAPVRSWPSPCAPAAAPSRSRSAARTARSGPAS